MKTEGVLFVGRKRPLRVMGKTWGRCLSGTNMNNAQLYTYVLVRTIIKLFFCYKNITCLL